MNEKRQGFYKFKEGKTDAEVSWENLVALISSLESKATSVGAFAIVRELAMLRKAAQRTNGNKKIAKSIQKKYEKYLEQVNNLSSYRQKSR